MYMQLADFDARIARLQELSLGLQRERALWEKGADPMLYLERKAYLDALSAGITAAEDGRMALVKAKIRLEEKAKQRQAKGKAQ